MKKLILFLALIILTGCGIEVPYPLIIKSKEVMPNDCRYGLKNRAPVVDKHFLIAPCEKWQIGDVLE